jgi:hypothetical protein
VITHNETSAADELPASQFSLTLGRHLPVQLDYDFAVLTTQAALI